jgi:hypothetical protein
MNSIFLHHKINESENENEINKTGLRLLGGFISNNKNVYMFALWRRRVLRNKNA